MQCDLCGKCPPDVKEYTEQWVATCTDDPSYLIPYCDHGYDLCNSCAQRIKEE